MYKIGEFANLTDVSVKTLRYYDQIDLLKPSQIDKYTNYRYYTKEELNQYKKIEYLKKIGFTLEEIKKIIDDINIEAINNKKNELLLKEQVIINQLKELDNLEKKLMKTKVKIKKIN